jgi:SAM-dependent methyltransferase
MKRPSSVPPNRLTALPPDLDLGCGAVTRVPGALRADRARGVRPDVVLDVEGALPFRDGALGRIYCYDVLEHVRDLPRLMDDLHRVLAPGGRVFITTPHFSCANAHTDPTHAHRFGWRSFDYFDASHPLAYYSHARFRIVHRVLRFHGGWIDAVVRRIAARWPDFYEHRLTWIFPAWYLEFELEVAVTRPAP